MGLLCGRPAFPPSRFPSRPQESDNFELEVEFNVYSKPHFGGDGFGIWFLSADQDPSTDAQSQTLVGPLFGMRADFKGVGVLFDIYDNDNQRNNPAVFVVQNHEGPFPYSHDTDFEHDMVKRTPPPPPGVSARDHYEAYKCVAEYRNRGQPSSVLLKYINNAMHVYLNTEDGQGWRFCLAVELARPPKLPAKKKSYLRDSHLTFSAATGQVADNIDIHSITLRYLRPDDVAPDQRFLAHFGTGSSGSTLGTLFWFVVTLAGLALTCVTIYEYYEYRSMVKGHIDAVAIAEKANQYMVQHFHLHAALTALLLITFHWVPFLINLPLVLLRFVLHRKQALLLNPNSITKMAGRTGGGLINMSADLRYSIALVVYSIATLYYLYHFFYY